MRTLIVVLMILTAMSVIGCGKAPRSHVDTSLEPYVTNFMRKAQDNGIFIDPSIMSKLSIEITDETPASALGVCRVTSLGLRVMINPTSWATMAIASREQLMFHELAHCLLGIQHDNRTATYFKQGSPVDSNTIKGYASMMNQNSLSANTYSTNRNYYIKQMFNPHYSETLYWDNESQFDESEYK